MAIVAYLGTATIESHIPKLRVRSCAIIHPNIPSEYHSLINGKEGSPCDHIVGSLEHPTLSIQHGLGGFPEVSNALDLSLNVQPKIDSHKALCAGAGVSGTEQTVICGHGLGRGTLVAKCGDWSQELSVFEHEFGLARISHELWCAKNEVGESGGGVHHGCEATDITLIKVQLIPCEESNIFIFNLNMFLMHNL